jgi:hypothetical protein
MLVVWQLSPAICICLPTAPLSEVLNSFCATYFLICCSHLRLAVPFGCFSFTFMLTTFCGEPSYLPCVNLPSKVFIFKFYLIFVSYFLNFVSVLLKSLVSCNHLFSLFLWELLCIILVSLFQSPTKCLSHKHIFIWEGWFEHFSWKLFHL